MNGDLVAVNLPFIIVALLLALGFYTIGFKRNLIKVVIGIEILEGAVNMFLVALGYVKGSYAPIYTLAPEESVNNMVLPTPQALTLTSIVIGVAVSALMLAFAVNIYRHYGTLDVTKIRRLRG
ncbi:cation:proton antiporter [Palaeococcus pacificus DY20341]|uniref:Cation:proton antiporter n=1 Tax=Palaeococcus pacificus DY20341 TaxID=1343739 RepID=A0A075LRG3_9EURY|nr:sodium:proton antiporter [Palaeococcus pacificus]AIF68681.1 cation:proton antiporter [Palaeococcus pacificus DY20341]